MTHPQSESSRPVSEAERLAAKIDDWENNPKYGDHKEGWSERLSCDEVALIIAALRSKAGSEKVELNEFEHGHVEACRRYFDLDCGIPTLSGQRALLAIIDRLTGKASEA